MKCQECGSALEGKAYRGAGYDLRAGAPKGSSLIARADFSGPELKGWRFGSAMHGHLQNGRWSITQANDGQNHPLLVAPGAYDSDGLITLRWQMPDHQCRDILVSVHPGQPHDPNDWRDVRWVARGQRHLAYLNGVLVISTQHQHILHSGFLDLLIQTVSPSVSLEVAELSLWEAG